MMFKKILGFMWISPVTLLGLLYATLFMLFGWYKWVGVRDTALVWQLNNEKAPKWLNSAWEHWGGHTVGNVVVMKLNIETTYGATILRHEQQHVHQGMVLGPFHPVIYGLCWIAIKLSCSASNAYYTNPFEVDARRAAGQLIDVEGSQKKSP